MFRKYLLWWIPNCDTSRLKPVLTLDKAVALANQGDPEQLANMVRLNWMIQDLRQNGMIKPIFCRDDFRVIVGDTRIMAAKLAGLTQVPVMCYNPIPLGQLCQTLDQLKQMAGFGSEAQVLFRPTVDIMTEPPDWIDIGDHRTRHHGHDQMRRLKAMQDYLEQNHCVFDRHWLMEERPWNDIFS
jgi:hypothetical protein